MLAAGLVWIVLLAIGLPGMAITVLVLVLVGAALIADAMGPERRGEVRALWTDGPAHERRSSAAMRNERTKLIAGALDRLSTASATAGFLVPVAHYVVAGGASGGAYPFIVALAGAAIFLALGWMLHMLARRALRSWEEDAT